MTEKKKPPLSKSERAANSRKGAKKSPWSKWKSLSLKKTRASVNADSTQNDVDIREELSKITAAP
jgi:hypothetical protein